MEQQHIIEKLALIISLPGGAWSSTARQHFSNICREQLPHALSRLLDKWTTPDEVLRIDRLEITIEAASIKQLEEMLVEEAIKKLADCYDPLHHHTHGTATFEKHPRPRSQFHSW